VSFLLIQESTNLRAWACVFLGSYKEELGRSPRLDRYVVQNLNRNPNLPFDEEEEISHCPSP
jgi:hypothetical protein